MKVLGENNDEKRTNFQSSWNLLSVTMSRMIIYLSLLFGEQSKSGSDAKCGCLLDEEGIWDDRSLQVK